MKKLLSVLFAVAFALSVSGFALAADNAAMPKKAEATEKVEKKAEKKKAPKKKVAKKKAAKKVEKKADEKAPEAPAEKK